MSATLIGSEVLFPSDSEVTRLTRSMLGASLVSITTMDNEAAMGEQSKTVSAWVDDTLVTTWTSEGAIPGTEVVKTEKGWEHHWDPNFVVISNSLTTVGNMVDLPAGTLGLAWSACVRLPVL